MLLKLKLSTHYIASNPSKFHMDDTCVSVFSSHSKTTSFFHLPPQIACVMGNTTTLLFFLSVLLCHGAMAIPEGEEDNLFLMHKPKRMVKTDAGEMRVLKTQSACRRLLDRHMHIAFITMEPNSLFVPHYLDSNLIIFIHKGEANLGFIYDDELVERRLKAGDVYVIPSGSAFYFVNMEEGQRLHIICSIDPSTSLGLDTFHSFYIGGGANSHSLFSEFGPANLETAFNESRMEVESIFYKELDGPIMYMDHSHAPSLGTKFLKLKKEEKEQQQLNKMLQDQEEEKEEKKQTSSSWEKLLDNVFGQVNEKTESKNSVDWSKATNLYDKKSDFRNDYGWSKALDGVQYSPLTKPDTGLFYVYLKAGSMLGPHVNPRASEYTIVLKGCGELHIVYPNGSKAISTEIKQGDVFVVPKSFPLCQIASRDGPLEFFGFSTSAKENKPLFLAGSVSILRTMLGPQLAAALGVSVDTLRRALDPQDELVIFPSTWSEPP
ncbi:vicilin-like seed storage protein At2g28490 [Vigna umbellata]|uniref:vicilin-like seed storage protein At2g28490 n=1 Tax=Vigna umbellata TaxID=87088 RepID=UPI001F5F3980|nr:vicilin-like seed storage protein At2g28490 [Vigna umbellata]